MERLVGWGMPKERRLTGRSGLLPVNVEERRLPGLSDGVCVVDALKAEDSRLAGLSDGVLVVDALVRFLLLRSVTVAGMWD